MAKISPGRWLSGIYVKPSQVAVGVLDFMEESPGDGLPWVGLLMVHAEHQGRGYAREALGALLERGRKRGWRALRVAVLRHNRAGLAFARRLGFQEVGASSSAPDGDPGALPGRLAPLVGGLKRAAPRLPPALWAGFAIRLRSAYFRYSITVHARP